MVFLQRTPWRLSFLNKNVIMFAFWTHFLAKHYVADVLNYDLKCTWGAKLFFNISFSDLFAIVLWQKTWTLLQSIIVTKHCNSDKCFVLTVNFAQILPLSFYNSFFKAISCSSCQIRKCDSSYVVILELSKGDCFPKTCLIFQNKGSRKA